MLADLLKYQFLQNAFIAGILASVLAGVIGFIIVEKKMIMMSGGIAHASYGGVGLGYLIGIEPIYGALGFSLLSAVSVGLIKRKGGTDSDIVIGLFWSLGMALGIIFISLMPGYPPNLTSYLFGNILAVTRADLMMMLVVAIFVSVLFISLFNNWKAYLFDEEFSGIRGTGVVLLEYLLLIMIALTVVVLIRIVGIILALAILIAPAATAKLLFRKMSARVMMSVVFGVLFIFFGIWLAYTLNTAAGAMIVLVAVITYVITYIATSSKLRKKIK
ncbi:MAG: metal ABC transporter permease [Firmicutes bacterium]|nr:metal ABC transporter permease [Bacillota bacterium]